jgi:hypothetical protein
MAKRYRQRNCSCVFGRDSRNRNRYMNMFISTWVLLVAGLVFALPMIYLRVKDTTSLADETMQVFVFLLFDSSALIYIPPSAHVWMTLGISAIFLINHN